VKRLLWVRPAITILVSAVLVGTLVSPAAANDAEEVPPSALSVAPLPTTPLEVPASTTPEGDFAGIEYAQGPVVPMRMVSAPRTRMVPIRVEDPVVPATPSFDVDTSIVQKQTEYSTSYLNADGTHTLAESTVPVNAQDASGSWVPIETHLERDAQGEWTTDAHPLNPTFAQQADAEGAFSVSRDGYQVDFTLDGAASSSFSRVSFPRQDTGGDTVVYRDVFENTDLQYKIEKGGVKEALILDSVPAYPDSYWLWHIDANALTLSVDENNVVNFTDRYGKVQFHIPTPTMWDSSGVEGKSESAEHGLATHVWRDGDGWALSISADYDWLTDPSRVYPVTIDPTMWSSGADNLTAYKSDGSSDSSFVRLGNTRESGSNVYWRTTIHYPYGALAGKQVLSAAIWGDYWDGTTGLVDGSLYTANCWGYNCAAGVVG
jgi:hypothetical protein